MIKSIKQLVTPSPCRQLLKKIYYYPRILRAKFVYQKNPKGPDYLPSNLIDEWKNVFVPVGEYDYSPQGLLERGLIRANSIFPLLKNFPEKRTLEIGCMDGMTSAALLKLGG